MACRFGSIFVVLQGYLTCLFGNVLLLGCFVDKQEGGATAVQAIGAIANFAMLTQVHMTAPQQHSHFPSAIAYCHWTSLFVYPTASLIQGLLQIWLANLMPSVAFLPLTALMASAGVVNACKFCGALNTSFGQNLWRSWQDFLGLLGIAMLPQVALCHQDSAVCVSGSASLLLHTLDIYTTLSSTPLQHNRNRSSARCCRSCSVVLLAIATAPQPHHVGVSAVARVLPDGDCRQYGPHVHGTTP